MPYDGIWKFFFIALAATALWLTAKAGYEIVQYLRLNTKTVPISMEWSVKEVTDEIFLPQASYIFLYDDKEYKGQSKIDEVFRNAWAAEKSLHNIKNRHWNIWFSSGDPQYSSLQKSFPIKESLSAILLWGLFAYFRGLRRYVSKLMGEK